MMIRVKDESGNIVPGLYKNELGAIVVKNNPEYQKYIQRKQEIKIINDLQKEVSEQKEIIESVVAEVQEIKTLLYKLINNDTRTFS